MRQLIVDTFFTSELGVLSFIIMLVVGARLAAKLVDVVDDKYDITTKINNVADFEFDDVVEFVKRRVK